MNCVRFLIPLLAIAAVFSLVTVSLADDDEVSLKDVDLGLHVHGPELEAKDLTGKVIVYEYWGDKCPPCIRAIPHLVELQEKYGRDQLNIIANQVWTRSTDNAKKAWKDAGGSDDITVINHGKLQGAKVTGVPHSFVFDHEGKLLWHGHPADEKLEATIKAAIAKLPDQG